MNTNSGRRKYPYIEQTFDQGHAMMHINSETAVEIIANEHGYIVNRFRNGDGWEEVHREEFKP